MREATKALIEFRDARDWKQFHDPKNLASALGIEAAELNEVFLWKSTEGSRDVDLARVKEELADVFAYALLMAEAFGLDPEQIVLDKVKANAEKYPVDKGQRDSCEIHRALMLVYQNSLHWASSRMWGSIALTLWWQMRSKNT